jgi:hypothetical protein
MMSEAAIETLVQVRKASRKKCEIKCSQVEQIVESDDEFDLKADDEIINWVKKTRNGIKLKDADDKQT